MKNKNRFLREAARERLLKSINQLATKYNNTINHSFMVDLMQIITKIKISAYNRGRKDQKSIDKRGTSV